MRYLFLAIVLPITITAQIATFEFTGSPSADNEFNDVTTQPDHGLFSPFSRSNVSFSAGNNVFNSRGWNTTGVLDASEYVGFTLSASPGFGLDLTGLSFKSERSGTGPVDAQVSLFLDNASTPAETFSFQPSSSALTSSTFDFADISGAASAEFRFYGLNASGSSGTLRFDEVATSGAITPVPEPESYSLVSGLCLCAWLGIRKLREKT